VDVTKSTKQTLKQRENRRKQNMRTSALEKKGRGPGPNHGGKRVVTLPKKTNAKNLGRGEGKKRLRGV